MMRRHEVVPADAVLLEDAAQVDYAFVTGEQTPVLLRAGETVHAGGRVLNRAVRLRLLEEASHSQLAKFWSEQVDGRAKEYWLTAVASRFGKWFTVAAARDRRGGAAAWWPDVTASLTVATAVLIVACPCAITLSAPITLGTAMGLLGTRGLYLKHPAIALDLSRIDTVVFDKTGTLTTAGQPTTVEHDGLDDSRALAGAAPGGRVGPSDQSRHCCGGLLHERRSGCRQTASRLRGGGRGPLRHRRRDARCDRDRGVHRGADRHFLPRSGRRDPRGRGGAVRLGADHGAGAARDRARRHHTRGGP